jgi:hypothetical protein
MASVANTNLKGRLTELKNSYVEEELPTDSTGMLYRRPL